MELHVYSLYMLSCLHIAIPIHLVSVVSLPFIPLHIIRTCLCAFFLYTITGRHSCKLPADSSDKISGREHFFLGGGGGANGVNAIAV